MTDTIKTVLIEDENEDLDLLKNLLSEHEAVHVVASARDIETGIAAISLHKPELIFLDINLYGRVSFDILDTIKQFGLNPKVVFTTAYNEYMSKAFKYAAFDYLLKPIDRKELSDTLNRYKEGYDDTGFKESYEKLKEVHKKLLFNTVEGYILIDPDQIVYLETEKNQSYTDIVLADKTRTTVTKCIGEVEKMINGDCFFKLHRSYIIHLKYVVLVNRLKRKCILKAGPNTFEIPISPEKAKLLKDRVIALNKTG